MAKRDILVVVLFLVAVTAPAAAQESVENLIAKLKSDTVQTQLETIAALEELGQEAKPAVTPLTGELNHRDARVRWHAARALGAIGSPDAVPALVASLKDEDGLVRAHAVRSLGLIGTSHKTAVGAPVVTQMAGMIADTDESVRRAVVKALLGMKPDRSITIPLFTKILEDSPQSVRLMVLHAMAEAGKQGVPALLAAMERKESRYWACLVLHEIGPEAAAAVPKLLEAAKDKEFEVRMEALMALGAIQPKGREAVDAIRQGLDDPVGGVQYAAAYALGSIGPNARGAGAELMKRLRTSGDEFLRITCAWALVRIYPNQASILDASMPILLRGLKHKQASHRTAAAKALAELKTKPGVTIPALVSVLGDEETRVLSNAVDGLVAFGTESVAPVTKALADQDRRLGAIFVLKRLGPKAKNSVTVLVQTMSKEPDLDVRREIFFALAAIGPGSQDAIAELIKALSHPSPKVRNGASYALGKIGPQARSALPMLRKNLSSKDDEYLPMISAWAMGQIDYENASTVQLTLPIFIKALGHHEMLVRVEAANTLAKFGPRARQAVEALQNALDDKDPYVRAAVAAALKKIQG